MPQAPTSPPGVQLVPEPAMACHHLRVHLAADARGLAATTVPMPTPHWRSH